MYMRTRCSWRKKKTKPLIRGSVSRVGALSTWVDERQAYSFGAV
jgi:hypothetical protein